MRHWTLVNSVAVLAVLAAGAAARAQQPAPGQLQASVAAASVAVQAPPVPGQLQAPVPDRGSPFVRFFRDAEWYFSWGYSKEWWAPSDIHVSQASLGNDFTLHGVRATDQFSASDIFSATDFFGPQ